jgi:4-amino-4-deoxy-L-arabinose transferase-like glycosyltransferase
LGVDVAFSDQFNMDRIRDFFKKEPSYRIVAFSSAILFAALALWSMLYRDFDHDEFEALHAAWMVFSGQTVYIDFFQHHHFLLYYLLSPLFGIFGEGTAVIMAARCVSLAFLVGIAYMTYRIARSAYGSDTALLSTFFLMTTYMFLDKAIEIRPDVPFVFSALVSVFFFLEYRESRRLRQLAWSAGALFVAFLFLQKAVFFGMVIGLIFLYETYRKQFGWREYTVFGGTFGILLAGFIWYVSARFGWSEYLFLNWELNTRLLNGFPFYKYLLRSVAQSPFFWLMFVVGVGMLIKQKTWSTIALFTAGLLGSVVLVKSPFPQQYLMSLPFVAIVAATALAPFVKRYERIVAVVMMVSTLWSVGVVWYMWEDNDQQLAKIEYVLSMTNPEDLVYDGDAQFNIFRKDIDYFWFSVKPKTGNLTAYQITREYMYDPYQLIGEKQPKVISGSFINEKNPSITERYVRSDRFKELYIRNR